MYAKDAHLYDLVYNGRGKDYAQEAADALGLILKRRDSVESLLDVACGTGAHLEGFGRSVPHVEGLELSEEMIGHARSRLPEGVPLHHADMRDFDLGRTFDAVTCMFSSIGHMETEDELVEAMRRMAAHLEPGGVVVVEPWWFPDTYTSGWVAANVVEDEKYKVARVSLGVKEGDLSKIVIHYVVASSEGIEHFTDNYSITLFTREQYDRAFELAGFTELEFIQGPPARPVGLFVGVRK